MPDSPQLSDRPRALIVNLDPQPFPIGPIPIGPTLVAAGFLVTETPVAAAIVEALRQAWPDIVVVTYGREQQRRAVNVLTVLRGARMRELLPVVVATDDDEYATVSEHSLARLGITVLIEPDAPALVAGMRGAMTSQPVPRTREGAGAEP